jgi:hypothetical protein
LFRREPAVIRQKAYRDASNYVAELQFDNGALLRIIAAVEEHGVIGSVNEAIVTKGDLGASVIHHSPGEFRFYTTGIGEDELAEYLNIAKVVGQKVMGSYLINQIGTDEWKREHFPFWMITVIREFPKEVRDKLRRGGIRVYGYARVAER